MDLHLILLVLASHFIGDFLLQSDDMAKNKSTSFQWLGAHALAYTTALAALGLILYFFIPVYPMILFWWALINGVAHFVVDAITSRINASLHKNGKIHEFFCSIGFDQLIHTTCLLVSLKYLLP